jgi:hypothetical protein
MPVALKIGPDGCLYMLDWYDRYHCSQDAARDPEGVDRLKGRLYRLRYKDTPRAPKIDLASESDDQLIARLGSGNIYFRETAQRILTERLEALRALPGLREESHLSPQRRRRPSRPTQADCTGRRLDRQQFADRPFIKVSSIPIGFRAWGVRAARN